MSMAGFMALPERNAQVWILELLSGAGSHASEGIVNLTE